jgi:hypothetical protein
VHIRLTHATEPAGADVGRDAPSPGKHLGLKAKTSLAGTRTNSDKGEQGQARRTGLWEEAPFKF